MKDYEDVGNNKNENGGDEGEDEDAEAGNDLQNEAEYLLGDEGPTSTEVPIC